MREKEPADRWVRCRFHSCTLADTYTVNSHDLWHHVHRHFISETNLVDQLKLCVFCGDTEGTCEVSCKHNVKPGRARIIAGECPAVPEQYKFMNNDGNHPMVCEVSGCYATGLCRYNVYLYYQQAHGNVKLSATLPNMDDEVTKMLLNNDLSTKITA